MYLEAGGLGSGITFDELDVMVKVAAKLSGGELRVEVERLGNTASEIDEGSAVAFS